MIETTGESAGSYLNPDQGPAAQKFASVFIVLYHLPLLVSNTTIFIMGKPIVLHLGDDIRWNHGMYDKFQSKFTIKRSYSMSRKDFAQALRDGSFGDFFAIYRPFWNTGGEMGNWDEELISLLPDSCKIFASAGAGFDWVDTACMAKRGLHFFTEVLLLPLLTLLTGILYCNAASACTESVADAAIWLILSTFRLFSWSAMSARSGDVAQFVDANRNLAPVSRNPTGHTLGIVGFGRIGRRVAEKAHKAMGMKILYNDVVQMPADLEKPTQARYYKDLGALLAESDCVVVAAPFSGGSILDQSAFKRMKRGSRLVNIARGKLVDEAALVEALKDGTLSAAGLDVHFDEPNVNKELIKMKNVEVMSHNAGASLDSHIGFEALGMDNILAYHASGKALTPVNAKL